MHLTVIDMMYEKSRDTSRSVTSVGDSLMVWEAFSSWRRALAFSSSRMNSEVYQLVLADNRLLFKSRFRRLPVIFQQDNAPMHVSTGARAW